MSFSVSDDGRHALINVAQQVRKIILLHSQGRRGKSPCCISQWGGENLATFLLGGGSSRYISQWGGEILLHFSVERGNCLASFFRGGGVILLHLSLGGVIFLLYFSGEEANYISLGRRGASTGYIFQGGEGFALHHPFD